MSLEARFAILIAGAAVAAFAVRHFFKPPLAPSDRRPEHDATGGGYDPINYGSGGHDSGGGHDGGGH